MKRVNNRNLVKLISLFFAVVLSGCNLNNPDDLSLSIQSNLTEAGTFQEITFTAQTEGTIPEDARYVWNFGDLTPTVSVNNNNSVTHTYKWENEYTVTVQLYDNQTNRLVKETSNQTKVTLNLYYVLRNYQYVTVYFKYMGVGKWERQNDDGSSVVTRDTLVWNYDATNKPLEGGTNDHCPLLWDDNNFSVTLSYSGFDIGNNEIVRTGYIKGSISDDGNRIENLEVSQTSNYLNDQTHYLYESIDNMTFSIINVFDNYKIYYNLSGAEVESHMSYTCWSHWEVTDPSMFDIETILYDNLIQQPELSIEFSGLLVDE